MKRKIFAILFALVLAVSLMMVPAASVGADPGPGIVGEWHFDEGTGTTAYDSAGTNHGTLNNMDESDWVEGVIGTALEFDGVNDYVIIPNDASQQITTNQITVSAWIKLNANVGPTQGRIISKQQSNGNAWGLEVLGAGYGGSTGNQLTFHDSNGSTWYVCMTPTDLNLNQWYHVAVTDNAGEIKIYINGELDWSCSGGLGIPSSINAPIYIGTFSPSRMFFPGVIDEVCIWDEALTADEIAALASPACVPPPSGMVSWWPGDGNPDDIVGENDGTLQGDATFTTGKVGQAFSFDGDGDYVSVPNDPIFDLTSQGSWTAWVKLDRHVGDTVQHIVSVNQGGVPDARQWVLEINQTNKLQMAIRKSDNTNWIKCADSQDFSLNQWVFVGATYDKSLSPSLNIYRDGNPVASNNAYHGDINTGTGSELRISSDAWEFNGLIDEVEIYNRALSASEIQDIYNAGSAGKCKVVPLDHFLGYKVKTTKVCDGGVTLLTLRYIGEADANVTVTAGKGDEPVPGQDWPLSVSKDQEFGFGTKGVKLGTSITITVDGGPETTIHTSCSQPIGPGETFGVFEVVDGESLKGGPLETPTPKFEPREVKLADQFVKGLFKVEKPDKLYNPADKEGKGINDEETHLMGYKVKLIQYEPEPACAPCKGGLTSLTLQYNGSSAALVTVTAKGEELFNDTVASGGQFKVSGTGKDGKLDKDVTITVDGGLETTIHTSCSQPIGIGQTFGVFEVVEGESKDGGLICPIITVESQFGTIVVARDKPDRLLVPTAKSLTGLVDELDDPCVDHFLGYKIKAPKVPKDTPELLVTLVDQFDQEKWYDVKKPTRLFVPVDKDGEVIKNPEAHLICYTIKPAKDQPKHEGVRIYTNNQFGQLKLNTDKEEELLVPCTKILP